MTDEQKMQIAALREQGNGYKKIAQVPFQRILSKVFAKEIASTVLKLVQLMVRYDASAAEKQLSRIREEK